jgi:hypothetical protein
MRSLTLLAFTLPLAVALAEGDPHATEVWTPVPPVVSVPANSGIPSDAVVLFDGTNLAEWQAEAGGAPGWTVADGVLTIKPGAGGIRTKREFADCQLHLEWHSPAAVVGEGQGRGNSGVYLQGRYEVQILDNYNNPTYANGQAASLYKHAAPLVNACRAPGEWQTYDIVYNAPRFNGDGSVRSPARVTVLHNGVLVQDHTEFAGPTAYIGTPPYEKHPFRQALLLQEHGNPVCFRNIWIRELNTRTLFNGHDLTGWYPFLDKRARGQDPAGVFRVEDGVLHVSGSELGYVATEESFANYHLRAEFKWGEKRYAPRDQSRRDSGILYHFAASEPDNVWPKSFECQVQEEDCGDVWCVGTQLESPNRHLQEWGMNHIVRSENFEHPRGEWNTIEIVCRDGEIEHWVNGHLVNSGHDASVRAGRILLQSEGAEVYYRNLVLSRY